MKKTSTILGLYQTLVHKIYPKYTFNLHDAVKAYMAYTTFVSVDIA